MISPPVTQIDRPSEAQVIIHLDLTAAHPAFDGHFPDHPVLPGVVQVDWAARLSTQAFGVDLRSATDFRVKYRRVVTPEARLSLTLTFDQGRSAISFEYRQGDEIVSTGQMKLRPRP